MSDDPTTWLADLPNWAFAFTLVLARCGGAATMLPGLGEAVYPPSVRPGLALAVTFVLLPGLIPLIPEVPLAGLPAAGMLGAELVTGLWFGWLARLVCLALPMAGQFIAYLLGISTVLQPDAELGPQTTALASLFQIIAPLAVLVTGLYAQPLAALAGSYRLIPPGALLPSGDGTTLAISAVAQAFALALQLASPFLIAGIVWHVVIGLMARLVPRLQVYFIAMPGQILGGLVLLAGLGGTVLAAWQDTVRDSFAMLPGN